MLPSYTVIRVYLATYEEGKGMDLRNCIKGIFWNFISESVFIFCWMSTKIRWHFATPRFTVFP